MTPYSRPDLAEEYPLVMTTGGRETTSFHSEHRQVASLRAIMPNPLVQINPETAAQVTASRTATGCASRTRWARPSRRRR